MVKEKTGVNCITVSLPEETKNKTVSDLLRHAAMILEGLGDVLVLDVVLHLDGYDEDIEEWHSLTIYYQ